MSRSEGTLEELCERITVGHVGKMSDQYVDQGGVVFLRSQDIKPFAISLDSANRVRSEFAERLRKSELRAGDVVVVRTGYPGTAAVVPEELHGSNCADLVVITPGPELDAHFLAGIFNSVFGQRLVAGRLVGAAQQHFNVSAAKSLRLNVLPYLKQKQSGAAIARICELIENNQRRIAILEEMARLIHREWFVHFRFPGHEGVELVDSDLGPIPQGWCTETLAEAAHLVMGQSPKSEFYNDDGVGLPFHQGVTNFGSRYPEHKKWCTEENRIAEDGDILLSVRAPVGRINVAPDRLVIGRGLSALRSRRDTQVYLFESLREVFAVEDSMGGGTIFKAVTKTDLERIGLVRPPADLVASFEAAVGPMFELVRNLTFQVRLLSQARDLLLPRLISGELDVSDLELDLEPVA